MVNKQCPHYENPHSSPEVIKHWKIAGYCKELKAEITVKVCNTCDKNPENIIKKPKPKKLLNYE